jgi:hypothetical protein
MVANLPSGYNDPQETPAPENVDLAVVWGNGLRPFEYGTALRSGSTWFITSELNEFANRHPCATPSGWKQKS